MKLLAFVLVALLAVTAVSAMSLPVPPDFADGYRLEVGEEQDISFTVRGDANTNEVEVFVRPVLEGYVEFDGDPTYTQTFVFDPYQERTINLELRALDVTEGILDDDVVTVQYGFYYQEEGVSDDFGFESLISSTFDVEVECDGCADEEQSEESTTSSGTGGTGGNTGTVQVNVDEPSEPPGPRTNNNDAVQSDLSPQSSATTEARVDTTANNNAANTRTSNSNEDEPEGRGVALSLLGLLAVTLMVNYAAIQHVKAEESGKK